MDKQQKKSATPVVKEKLWVSVGFIVLLQNWEYYFIAIGWEQVNSLLIFFIYN